MICDMITIMEKWGWIILSLGAGLLVTKAVEWVLRRHWRRRRDQIDELINTPIYYKRAEDRDEDTTSGIHTH
jgi:hypothetical protein